MKSKKNKNERVRSTKRKIEEVPMTPMIDVVFQMLVYFVITFEVPDRISQMRVWRPAGQATSSQQEEIDVTRITVYENTFALNDRRVSLETLERDLYNFADLNPEQSIIVVATAPSYHRDLVSVLNLLSKAGLNNISLLSSE